MPLIAMLERLIYQSTASREFGSLALFHLLDEARRRNAELDITGHLLYFEGHFTQCLEGPVASLDAVWRSLLQDQRHHDVQLLARYPVEQRRFSDWSMAFSTYRTLYVHGMSGFFPLDEQGRSPLVDLCQQGPT
jgi:hypothetical protein